MVLAAKRKRLSNHDTLTVSRSLKERMRAVVICVSRSWGGLEQIAAYDARQLSKLDLDVHFMCLKDSPIHQNLLDEPKLKLLPLDFQPRDFLDLRLRSICLDLTQKQGVNLFHCHQPSLLSSIIPWVYRNNRVVVLASRHIMNAHDKRNPFHALIYRRLDALIVMSQTLRENVLGTHPLRERQVKVIHYGLDFSRFNPEGIQRDLQRAEWGADADTILIGLVGRIDPAKGQSTFIKAAAGLLQSQRGPQNISTERKFKFVIVGEETRGRDSNHLGELQKMVEQFHLQDRIVFAGFKENIPEVMSALDIFVMPSRQEAFGLVAIEAMAMKCPIVISSGGSADEIVGKEEFGLLVRPDDAFDLRGRLTYLLDHPEKRKEMGERAREHVLKNYDRHVRLERTLNLYERMLRRRGM